jgi:hypothetical protein
MEVEMQFDNFINEPTSHFFTWMTDGGGTAALPGLLAKAFGQVEDDPRFMMGEGFPEVAREKLAELLEVHLLDFLGEGGWIGEVDDRLESLTRPLLELSLSQIDFKAVAVLIREKKWAPDKVVPEMFPLPEEQERDKGIDS